LKLRKSKLRKSGSFFYCKYLLGTGLDADSAGYTLARVRGAFRADHHLEGAGFEAFAAVYAGFFVDHVDPAVVLGDCPGLAGLGAFTALDAKRDCGLAVLFTDLNTRKPDVIVLVKRPGAGQFTSSTGHTGRLIDYRQFFHRFQCLHSQVF
jgi:hypothetical protein